MLVLAPQAFAVGTHLTVRFPLPLTGEIVALGANVRWARPRHRKQSAMGLELVAVPDSIKKTIAKYVETGA
jgi:hypothetical protein